MKTRWLVAILAYAAACVGSLFAPWPDSFETGDSVRSDWALFRELLAAGSLVQAVRICWMVPLLAASSVVWISARRGIRPAHAEISLALALGAVAYPFVSFPQPGSVTIWAHSSAAAFTITFAGVLGWRAILRQREELPLSTSRSTASF